MNRELADGSLGSIGPAAVAALRAEVIKSELGVTDIAMPFMKKMVERHNSLFKNDVNSLEEQRARQQAIQESELMFRQIENLLNTRRAV